MVMGSLSIKRSHFSLLKVEDTTNSKSFKIAQNTTSEANDNNLS